jgi:magnesium-protoporphyrin IX monomethyl ester (oxidative) cyclase
VIRTVLINPPQIFVKTQVASGVQPPLGVAYLAAYLLRDGHPVGVVDALGEAPETITAFRRETFLRGLTFDEIAERIEPDTDLVGISNLFSFAYPAVEALAQHIKERFPQVKIVLGGPHPTAQYREILESVPAVDYVAIGEAEESLLRLVLYLDGKLEHESLTGLASRSDDGEVVVHSSARRIRALQQESVPFPARHLLPMESYIRTQESHGASNGRWTSILSSRGCPYGCTFCASRRTLWVSRPAKDVVDEMQECLETWGIREFHFEDDNMTVNEKRLIEICDEIIARGLDVVWQTPNGIRASRTNEKMLRKMKESGCSHVTLAPESGSPRVLKEIIQKGKDFDLDQLAECGRTAHKVGMKVAAYFILGLPGETREEMLESIRYARRLARVGVDEAGFALFIPLPGTPLWDASQHHMADKDWLDLLTIGDLSHAVSFDDEVDSETLNALRRRAYLWFFATRAFFHPLGFVRTLWNVARNYEETKTERSIRQLLQRFGIRRKRYSGPEEVYPYEAARTLEVLLESTPSYSFKHGLRKTLGLLRRDSRRNPDRADRTQAPH